MKKREFETFKQNVDCWVKDMNGEISTLSSITPIVEENISNIDHNYELIQDMRTEIKQLRDELSAMKILQILSIRSEHLKKA